MAGKNALFPGTLTFLANFQKSAFAPTVGFCGEGKLIQSAGSVTWFVHILIGVSVVSNSFCHTVKGVEFKKGLADPLTRMTALPCCSLALKGRCLFCSQSPAEQKGLSDSGEDPQGEVEPPHHGLGDTESAGERDSEHPAPAVASVSATLSPASEAQLAPIQQELAGVSVNLPSTSAAEGIKEKVPSTRRNLLC